MNFILIPATYSTEHDETRQGFYWTMVLLKLQNTRSSSITLKQNLHKHQINSKKKGGKKTFLLYISSSQGGVFILCGCVYEGVLISVIWNVRAARRARLHESDNCINWYNGYTDSLLGCPRYYGATSGAEFWHTYGGYDSPCAALYRV